MAKVSNPLRYDGVYFQFHGAGEHEELRGTVLLRDGDLVLDIRGGDGPYLIVGKQSGHSFKGTNSDRSNSNSIEAKWSDVGGIYVGQWIEDGYDFLFSFELPKQKPASKRRT